MTIKTITKVLIRMGIFIIFLELFFQGGGMLQRAVMDYKTQRNLKNIHLEKQYRIVVMGESLALWIKDTGPDRSYPKQLEEILNQRQSQIEFKIINKGWSLETTSGTLARLPAILEEYKPDMVILMVGAVDADFNKWIKEGFLSEIKHSLWLNNLKTYRLAKKVEDDLQRFIRNKKDKVKKLFTKDQSVEGVEISPNNAETPQVKTESKKMQYYYDEDDPRVIRAKHYWEKLDKPHPLTIMNYNEVIEVLRNAGKKIVVMQYPTLDVGMLKNIFFDKGNIIFVENKKNFEEVIVREGVEEVFVDNFFFKFGHGTERGNRLIAENLADAILKNLSLGE